MRKDERQLIDPQRMLWRDDVEGICPTIDMCFEYGEHVRCGPCAIKQSIARGVEPDLVTIPNLPEVSRLTRENKRIQDELNTRSSVTDEMVERAARALALEDRIEICSDATYRLSSYGPRARAALTAALGGPHG